MVVRTSVNLALELDRRGQWQRSFEPRDEVKGKKTAAEVWCGVVRESGSRITNVECLTDVYDMFEALTWHEADHLPEEVKVSGRRYYYATLPPSYACCVVIDVCSLPQLTDSELPHAHFAEVKDGFELQVPENYWRKDIHASDANHEVYAVVDDNGVVEWHPGEPFASGSFDGIPELKELPASRRDLIGLTSGGHFTSCQEDLQEVVEQLETVRRKPIDLFVRKGPPEKKGAHSSRLRSHI